MHVNSGTEQHRDQLSDEGRRETESQSSESMQASHSLPSYSHYIFEAQRRAVVPSRADRLAKVGEFYATLTGPLEVSVPEGTTGDSTTSGHMDAAFSDNGTSGTTGIPCTAPGTSAVGPWLEGGVEAGTVGPTASRHGMDAMTLEVPTPMGQQQLHQQFSEAALPVTLLSHL